MGYLANRLYGAPSERLDVVGITGTNGKTTVSFLIEAMLEEAGMRPGVIGTISHRFGGEAVEAANTTPESSDLHSILIGMAERGATHGIVEVSSHGLAMRRVEAVRFRAGVFTNFSQDHLDFHRTMEDYFRAKSRFFREVLPWGNDGRPVHAVVNLDDPRGNEIAELSEVPIVGYGEASQARVRSKGFEYGPEGCRGEVETPDGPLHIASPLVGPFNGQNILAAVALGWTLGLTPEVMGRGVDGMTRVPGRLERVSGEGEPLVLVDYAHTEDALRNVIRAVAEITRGRLITVFGCGGDRDRTKRPLMGEAAAVGSDIAIVTTDNPRTEDPMEIIAEIEAAVAPLCVRLDDVDTLGSFERGPDALPAYTVIPDRRSAIEAAVLAARARDTVLIAGKGHETYQIVGTTKYPFDDCHEARKALVKRS